MIERARVLETVVAIFVLAPAQLNADTALERRFRSQAPAGWKRLASAVAHIEGTGTDVQNVSQDKDDVQTADWDFRVNGSRIVFEFLMSRPGHKQRRMVRGVNNDYAFILRGNVDADTWEITSITDSADEMEHISFFAIAVGFQRFLHSAWKLEGVEFSKVMEHSSFTLQDISVNDRGHVRVQFDYNSGQSGPSATGGNIGPGWVDFDPSLDWAIQRYDVKPPFGHITGELKYADLRKKPYVSEAYIIYSSPHGTREWKWTTTQLTHVDVPDAAFRLTAYGFPEPMTPKRKWTTPLVLGAAALLFLALAVILYRRR